MFLILSILVYLLITIAIGYWASSKVKTAEDFALAGKSLPLSMASTALFATWFGSETVLGASADFAKKGVLGIIQDPFAVVLCLLIVGTFFARLLYRMNLTTFNDYFRVRYGARAEQVSAWFMIPSYFGWVAAQLVAMAFIFQSLFGSQNMPLPLGITICTIIVVFYTYTGGMWAVSITDFLQTIVIIGGLFILTWVMLDRVGGFDKLIAKTPKETFNFLPPPTYKEIMAYIAAWITIGLGSVPQQDLYQRLMAGKSERVAVWSSFIAAGLYIVVSMMPLILTLCAKILYPQLLADEQKILPNLVSQHSPEILQILFFGALISAILSTASGAMLAPAVVLSENIMKPYYPNLTDKQLLKMMRICVLFIAICSGAMGIINHEITELVAQSSAIGLVSLFVPFVAGLTWKKASAIGSILSMVFGFIVWLITANFELLDTPSVFWGLGAGILSLVIGSYLYPDKKEQIATI
jgi:SSS family transporter